MLDVPFLLFTLFPAFCFVPIVFGGFGVESSYGCTYPACDKTELGGNVLPQSAHGEPSNNWGDPPIDHSEEVIGSTGCANQTGPASTRDAGDGDHLMRHIQFGQRGGLLMWFISPVFLSKNVNGFILTTQLALRLRKIDTVCFHI